MVLSASTSFHYCAWEADSSDGSDGSLCAIHEPYHNKFRLLYNNWYPRIQFKVFCAEGNVRKVSIAAFTIQSKLRFDRSLPWQKWDERRTWIAGWTTLFLLLSSTSAYNAIVLRTEWADTMARICWTLVLCIAIVILLWFGVVLDITSDFPLYALLVRWSDNGITLRCWACGPLVSSELIKFYIPTG